MDFSLEQACQSFVDQPVSLYWLQTFEAGRHDPHVEVPLARRSVTEVGGAVITNFQMRGIQPLLQQPPNMDRGRIRSIWHGSQAASASRRAESHSA